MAFFQVSRDTVLVATHHYQNPFRCAGLEYQGLDHLTGLISKGTGNSGRSFLRVNREAQSLMFDPKSFQILMRR